MYVCVLVECVVAISPWHECSHLHYLRLIEILWMLTMCLGEVLFEITECSAWTILLHQFFILYPLQEIGVENVFTHFSLFISFNKLYFIVCVCVPWVECFYLQLYRKHRSHPKRESDKTKKRAEFEYRYHDKFDLIMSIFYGKFSPSIGAIQTKW